MRNNRVYGESKTIICPFCEKEAYEKNKQKIPVCKNHKSKLLREDFKCICGQYLLLCEGKYGPYFKCNTCGNINLNKAIELNNFTNEELACKREKDEKSKKNSNYELNEKNKLMKELLKNYKK